MLWAIILGLVPLVRSGLVKLWVIDPKGGMELAAGRRLFDRFAYGDAATSLGYETALAELLEDAVAEMRRRADRLRGHTRLHTPTTVEPLIVVVVDELAALTAWITDRTMPSGSTPPCRCCSARAGPSGSWSSGRCRTPARTSSRNATCSRSGSAWRSARPSTSGCPSAPMRTTAARTAS